jgi:dienelactone hydrolase
MEPEQESTAEAQNALGGLPPPGNYSSNYPGHHGMSQEATLELFGSRGPYGFATRDYTFVDPTRSTPPNNSYPGSPVRTLRTRVFYPAFPPELTASPPPAVPVPIAHAGRFPIVAYAHGLTSRGEPSRFMCEHLATHGYICVAPLFPLSNGDAPGGPTLADLGNQPGDLDFVMNQVAQVPEIGPAVDTKKRGIMGFSAGGLTTLLATYHPTLQIPNIKASVAQAPVSCFLGAPVFSRSIPTLLISGTADMTVPIAGVEQAFMLAPPKVVLAKLIGGTHSGFMNVERPLVPNSDILVCQMLLAANPQQADAQIEAVVTQGAGPGAFEPSTCGQLCGQVLPQTMGATRQIKLARAATLAHFEAFLRGNQFALAFLTSGLDTLPDVEVSVKF